MKLNRKLAVVAVAALAMFSVAGATLPASAHERHEGHKNRGATTVVLNQALVGTLVNTLGVQVVAPGALSAPNGVAQVAFPITFVEHGKVGHRGGLDFTKAAAGDVKITKFVVDTKKGVLTAKTKVNGKYIGRIAIFTLGAPQEVSPGVTPSCAGIAAGLSLTPTAASALLGDATATAFIGDACVVPAKHKH